MNHNLTLELNEQVFAAILRQAETIGISPEQLATTILEQQFTQSLQLLLNKTERNAARTKFERHFGTLTLSTSMSLDNKNINADLEAV